MFKPTPFSGARTIKLNLLIHAVTATPANVADSTVLPDLLHGQETQVWGDQAYRGQRAVIRQHAPKAQDFGNRAQIAIESTVPGRPYGGCSIVIRACTTGLLSHLEPDRLAGRLLTHGRAIDGMSERRHIFHLQADDVAASQLTMARLNIARSRVRPSICSLFRIDQTCLGRAAASPLSVCPYSRVRGAKPEGSDL